MPVSDNGLYMLNVRQMITMLSSAYVNLIENQIPFSAFPSLMLWGAPGVGKSQGVRAVAERIRQKTGKRVEITDVRLLLFNPVDLRGIPAANEDRTLAVWLKPKIFQMEESDDVVNILFLDEISAAPQSVQAAAYQITLDRAVGEHKLPENCIVMAAGNRVTDRGVAYVMPRPLANRLCHLEITVDANSWHDWAIKKGLHPFVVGYLAYNPPALNMSEETDGGTAFPTPRSWEMVSNVLNSVSDNIRDVYPMLVGCVGHEATKRLFVWSERYSALPSVQKIFKGTESRLPKTEEERIALSASLVFYAAKHPEPEGVEHAISYACNLTWNFRKKLFHDLWILPKLKPFLEANATFCEAMRGGW